MKRERPRPDGYHWNAPVAIVLECGSSPCRWCKGPIPKCRRRTFCSEPCVNEWKRRVCPEIFRSVAFEADKGICRSCGLDCLTMDHDHLQRQLWTSAEPATILDRIDLAQRWRHANNVRRHVFEIDHITPIIEGGDWFDPANLRTLCIPCHRRETRALAARLAVARRNAAKRRNGVDQ